MKVAAVVVTYNRKDMLATCLRKLRQQEGAACDILVIDNASTDGTGDMVRECFSVPEIRYFNTGANLGGAGGFSFGIRAAASARVKSSGVSSWRRAANMP